MSNQTPSQTVGPFFSFGLFAGDENVLTQPQTAGEHIYIKGIVLDGDGQPVKDALIEIWQADARGYFNHPKDKNRAKADPTFRGFGRSETVDGGTFSFKTIKPGSIGGAEKAPYVNVRVFARGMLTHAVTRLYFSDEAANDTDEVLNSIPAQRRQTLIARREEADGIACYCFDIRLQGDDETVFFDA